MEPLADAHVTTVGEQVIELSALDRFMAAPDGGPSCDSRIPLAVSTAFRRAVRRVKAENGFSPACDIGADDAWGALEASCDAVRRAYVSGRAGPVGGGPLAAQMLERLRGPFIEELDRVRGALKLGELSTALRAFELVRKEMDGDDTQQFLAALRSDDALDVLVEIAHDMRSPLTAILMLTQMVRRAQSEAQHEVQARQMAVVYSAAFGLNALVNDVLALARGGNQLIDSDPVPFSVSSLMESVAAIIRPIAEERQLALVVNAPPTSWRAGQPIALSRVLLNLASNALKYTEAGEVTISAVDLGPTHVRFEVADTGPGIPPDVIPVLFEVVVHRSTTAPQTRRFSRTGLGLAICRKLLGDMGTELRVDTARGKGTRFFFELTLPVAPTCDVGHEESSAAIL
jgi:signal transduction histidine kinase